ncbi:TetR/AcrR family transcriptional regulator [Kribbella sp. NPDC051718]|uniref:TetR/AcrR family transcriptional regulator n=1 Tax=Kribbella sp. NPDC051718 TaxID=3155168 RepID=UPI0034276FDF
MPVTPQPSPEPTRRPRKDAERNRQRLLDAAGELFVERGFAVSLEEIAARAGLGVGTVYRHIDDRAGLLSELLAPMLEEVLTVTRQALDRDDPGPAFFWLLRELAERVALNQAMRDVLLAEIPPEPMVTRLRAEFAPLGTEALRRAQAAGAVRDDLGPTDLPLLLAAVGSIEVRFGRVAPGTWERFLTLLLDGLTPSRTTTSKLAVVPLTDEQLGELSSPE